MTPSHDKSGERKAVLDDGYRLWLAERALKFDPDTPYRRQAVREYLDLTEPRKEPTP